MPSIVVVGGEGRRPGHRAIGRGQAAEACRITVTSLASKPVTASEKVNVTSRAVVAVAEVAIGDVDRAVGFLVSIVDGVAAAGRAVVERESVKRGGTVTEPLASIAVGRR